MAAGCFPGTEYDIVLILSPVERSGCSAVVVGNILPDPAVGNGLGSPTCCVDPDTCIRPDPRSTNCVAYAIHNILFPCVIVAPASKTWIAGASYQQRPGQHAAFHFALIANCGAVT